MTKEKFQELTLSEQLEANGGAWHGVYRDGLGDVYYMADSEGFYILSEVYIC